MWSARIEAIPPQECWCTLVGQRVPATSVTILGYYPLGDGTCLEHARLEGGPLEVVLGLLQEHPQVLALRTIDEGPGYLEVQLTVPLCGLDAAIRASGAVPVFPLPVRGGREQLLLRAEKGVVATFIEGYRSVHQQAHLKAISHNDGAAALTDRQREVLEAAVAWGYYDVPRRTSLSELARRQGVAKSTLCELLMTIEGKVMRELTPEVSAAVTAPPPEQVRRQG